MADVAVALQALQEGLDRDRVQAAQIGHILFPMLGDGASESDAVSNEAVLHALLVRFPDRVVTAGSLAKAIASLDDLHSNTLSGRAKKIDRLRWAAGEAGVLHEIWSWCRKLWRSTSCKPSARTQCIARLKSRMLPRRPKLQAWPALPECPSMSSCSSSQSS